MESKCPKQPHPAADNYIKVLKSLQFNFFSMTSTDEGGKVNVLIDYQFTSALKSAVSLGKVSHLFPAELINFIRSFFKGL